MGFKVNNVSWEPGGLTGETITSLNAGWYYSTITLINREGDQLIKVDSIEVLDVGEKLFIDVEATDEFCVTPCSGSAIFNPISGDLPYTYSLGPETNNTGIFTDVCIGNYPILITDSNGCSYLDTLNFNDCLNGTDQNILFNAPNVFTPNKDLVNDHFTFEFMTIGIETFSCFIVNRWGNVVATLDGVNDYWDGRNLRGEKCSNGTYFYTYQAVNVNGKTFKGQGNVQLVR